MPCTILPSDDDDTRPVNNLLYGELGELAVLSDLPASWAMHHGKIVQRIGCAAGDCLVVIGEIAKWNSPFPPTLRVRPLPHNTRILYKKELQ